ncbi:sulfite exporter TauE/SafE family protein [Gottfriedia luciferensis]|uniref:sulfite exporter TauE/SafE family protein n=1 Tax=Gottfriedia luciferensis TaxID=178774 RepID=UPI000B430EB7|nr:sulfite exporter TauE/SafE family protein [Gottfriedia luciferensis]
MDSLLLLFILGAGAAIVGTLAGGGGLITLPMMIFLGIPIQTGIATNKFASGLGSFSSILYTIKKKDFKASVIIQFILVSILGGGIGAFVTSMLDEHVMNIVALVLLTGSLLLTLASKKWNYETMKEASVEKQSLVDNSILTGIGIYDGGFGPGSSTFAILYFLKKGFTYVNSVQLARVLNFGSCLSAFIIFYVTGHFQWKIAVTMAAASIVGNQVGLRFAEFVPMKLARILLISVSVLLIVQVSLKIFI